MILVIWMFSFKPDFSLSSFTFIKRLFSAGTVCISTFSLCPGYSLTCVKRDNHFMPEGKLLLAVWNHVISFKSKYMFPPTLQTVQLLLVFAIVVCVSSSACLTLHSHGLESVRLFCPCDFPRREYWSGLPYPPPGALHDLGIKPRSPTLQADSLPSELPGKAFVIVITDQLCSWEEKLYLPHYHLKNWGSDVCACVGCVCVCVCMYVWVYVPWRGGLGWRRGGD